MNRFRNSRLHSMNLFPDDPSYIPVRGPLDLSILNMIVEFVTQEDSSDIETLKKAMYSQVSIESCACQIKTCRSPVVFSLILHSILI